MKIDLATLNFRCPDEDFDTMMELCEQNEISASDYITQAILMYTDLAEKEDGYRTALTTNSTHNTHG